MTTKVKKVVGNDAFQRINFLYQEKRDPVKRGSATSLTGLCYYEVNCVGEAPHLISKYVVDKNPALSSYYSNIMLGIARKSVLKIHPDIKRQICKKCRCILIDTKSAKMKIKRNKKQQYIEWTCNICHEKKLFLSDKNKDHTLWVEKPDGVAGTFH